MGVTSHKGIFRLLPTPQQALNATNGAKTDIRQYGTYSKQNPSKRKM
jgi:hypothetical protein